MSKKQQTDTYSSTVGLGLKVKANLYYIIKDETLRDW